MSSATDNALREQRLEQEKRQLASSLSQRIHELTVLNMIGRSITTVLDLDQLLTRIVEAAMQLTGAEEGFLLLRDHHTDRLNVRAAKTRDDVRAQVLRMPVEDSLAGQVMHTGQPVRTGHQPSSFPIKVKTGYLARSLLMVPLVTRHESIGVLSVNNVIEQQPFNEAHERLLCALADYAVIALENARLMRAVQRSETRYRDLFTNAHDLLLVVDQHLQIVEVNGAGPTMLGYAAPAFSDQPLRWLVSADHWTTFELQLRQALSYADDLPPCEIDLRKHDGSSLRVEFLVRTIEDADGQRQLFCTARDLTERLQLQANAVQAEKVAALEQMVAGVAHELNNPLASIVGYGQLLQRDPELTAQAQQDVTRIVDQAQRASEIVNGMISFGRGAALKPTTIDLASLIQRSLAARGNTLRGASIEIDYTCAPQLPRVPGDAFHLDQVLDQLISNAQTAMPDGGQLSVCAYPVLDLRNVVVAQPTSTTPRVSGPVVMIEVRDTGVGIAEDQLRHIFDPFWTTSEVGKGTGLGLAACSGIIAQHHGAIWASSVVGSGTTIYVALPIHDNASSVAC